ncbi:UvrB/UvrC motif-containing protein [bacterium]|nr:UvrB/UvrC motif-containing protein [bacterium]
MLCYLCKKTEATVHLAQIAEGKMQKIDLCETCAREKGVQDAGTNVSLASLLMGLGVVDEVQVSESTLRCPACGFTQADFKKAGRLGCSTCWEVFEAGLQPLLKAMHKGDRHLGKVPRKAAQTVALSAKIKELTAKLDQAVQAERYEEAAQLRDQVRALEADLKVAGT